MLLKMAAGSGRISHHSESQNEDEEEYMDYEEEPDNFDDPEDFIDDVTDEDLVGDLLKKRPKATDGIDNVIVVDSIPQVGPERLEKLKNVIKKLYSKFGKVVNDFYPMEGELTKGYMFLEFSSPLHAQEGL